MVALVSCGSAKRDASPAGEHPPASRRAFDRGALAAWFDREVAPRTPAVVMGIVEGDQLVWQRAAGSRDGKGGPPPDRTSMFRIGSITKVVTAIAAMQLRERGVLDFDAPVATWVPELRDRLAPPGQPAVTLRHLVTHTSGIPGIGDGSAPYWQQTPPTEAAMLKSLDTPLMFAPGSRSVYSNAGMALVGVIVARAAKRPYRDYMASEVLAPIGMAAAWDASAFDASVRVAGAAPSGAVDPPTWQLGAFEPAGGLWANLDQMVALARFTLGRSGADRVLSADGRRAMTTDDPLPGEHGVAWVVGPGGVGHTGSTTDYSASIIVSIEAGLAAIVLSAGSDTDLTDCAALAVVRALTDGSAPASCAKPVAPRGDPALIADAFKRLLAFLARPDATTAEAAFTPEFLGQVPLATLLASVAQVATLTGACTGHTLADPGAASGDGHLICAKGKLRITYALDGKTPSRFAGTQAHGLE